MYRINITSYRNACAVLANPKFYTAKARAEAERIVENRDSGATFDRPQKTFKPAMSNFPGKEQAMHRINMLTR